MVALYIEFRAPRVLAAALKRGSCRLCRAKLEEYERPEMICNTCLRAHQTMPRAA